MIIVFFHVLYLIGKLFYKNYRLTDPSDNEAEKNAHEINESICGEGTSQLETSQSDHYTEFYDDDNTKITFSPPAYIQRYVAVTTVLTDDKYPGQIRKVVDFGCSELSFIQHLKNIKGIEEILCVDIDRNTLEIYKKKVEPLTSDYLVCRDTPLTIHVYEGSVTQSDESLENCDAVIGIELIEHLYPDTLMALPYNIFGFIQPQIAVFTTPNADFNVLFKGMRGFRHWDHKFEWTREQFQDWSNNIVTRYPNYSIEFDGVCPGPLGSESLGHCSQMAIFHRQSPRIPLHGTPGLFSLVASEEYPYRVDNRPDEEKILHEAAYYIRSYGLNNEDEEMSLELLAKWMNDVSVAALKDVLENEGWRLVDHEEKGISVLCQRNSEYSDYDINEDFDDIVDDSFDHADDAAEDWDSEPGPPVYRHQIWPEIHDQDEENWEYYETIPSAQQSITVDQEPELPSVSIILQSNLSVDSDSSIGLSANETPDRLLINSCDTSEGSRCRSISTNESSEIVERSKASVVNKTFDGSLLTENSLVKHEFGSLLMENEGVHDDSRILGSSGSKRSTNNRTFDGSTLASICSMYLQSSSCENNEECPENITNYEFQISGELDESYSSINDCRKTLQYSCENSQNVTSTPVETRLEYYRGHSETEELDESSSPGRSKDEKKFGRSALMASFEDELVEENENSEITLDESMDKTGEFSGESNSSESHVDEEKDVSIVAFEESSSSGRSKDKEKFGGNALMETFKENENSEITLDESTDKSGEFLGESNSSEFHVDEGKDVSIIAFEGSLSSRRSKDEEKFGGRVLMATFEDKVVEENENSEITLDDSMDKTGKFLGDSNPSDSHVDEEKDVPIVAFEGSLSSGRSKDGEKFGGNALIATLKDDLVKKNENSEIILDGFMDKTGEFLVDSNLSECHGDERKNVLVVVGVEAECKLIGSKRSLILESISELMREGIASKDVDDKGAEARESPLNSWSPEVMDSGYPNTSSAHDMTPECDLSSICNDKVSGAESPDVDDAPRCHFEFENNDRVENGDLANNNRDGEGNNVDPVQENEIDDLQPIIERLENDLENENDIYDFQNGFPVWLLRILDAEGAGGQQGGGFHIAEGGAGANADNIHHDEGIDSSSSENGSDNEESDENKNINKNENQHIDTSDEDNNDDIEKHTGELRSAKDT